MLSNPRWLAGAAAGLTAGVLSLWAVRGLPLGLASFWLTPLPLFMAGLGFGPMAMAGAAGVAAAMHLVLAGLLPAAVFLIAFAAPAQLLVVAGLRREGISLGLPLALLGLWPAAVILVAALLFADRPDGLEGVMRGVILTALGRMGLRPEEVPVAELVRVMPAALAFWSAVALSVNAAAAQAALSRWGLALASTPRWSMVQLPAWYPVAPALAAVIWLGTGGGAVALSLLVTLLLPVFLQGLAAVHRRSSGKPGRGVLLGLLYAGLLILSVPAAIAVTAFGFYDQWGRRSHPPGGTT